MRTLWILLICLIACENLEAQYSREDSSFLLQYSNEGIPARTYKSLPPERITNRYFLARFQQPFVNKGYSSLKIVRQLSSQHAIIRIDVAQDVNEIFPHVDYIFVANDNWKLPTGWSINNLATWSRKMLIVFSDPTSFLDAFTQLHGRIINQFSFNTYEIELEKAEDAVKLLQEPSVVFLQPISNSKEELLINGFDLGTNRVNLAHRRYPSITGAGLVVAVKENKFDTTDIDFKGRYVPTGVSSNVITGHASIMTTMIAGGGNSYHLGKGAAWNAQLSSTNFSQLLPSPDAFYNQFHISVENHSYGTAIENFYGADAAAYDASANSSPSLVHVFSSGNSGTFTSTSGKYSGISNFANLTGSFKMAKNIITVGATDSFNTVEVLSSRGPAYDGRIKPDLVAFGQDGSSGAAALVSGTVLLMQHAYKLQHHDSLPTSALVRAVVINSADEIGAQGPDYISGFGSLNTANAIQTIMEGKFSQGSVTNQSSAIIPIVIPPGVQQFKMTMAYTDPPTQANAFKALVNDLDLELVHVSSGQTWKPWTLSIAPNKDSLLLPAVRNRDSLNNVEQISIDQPAAGNYEMRIFGRVVTNASQTYALAYKFDSINSFRWDYPTKNDPVIAGTQQLARWNSTYSGNGTIEFSSDGGATWQLIGSAELAKKYFKWQTTDLFQRGILKMTINGNVYVSDTFVISRTIEMKVGFNCPDSVLLSWNKLDKADQYRIYALTSNFLQPVATRSDTFFIFSKADINTKHFTVAPLTQTSEGIKAYTINYETQGVGCYLKEFLVQLNVNKAIISLILGSTYNLKQIEIQKDNGHDFASFQTVSNPNQLAYDFENANLHPGVNRFRAKLTLNNGVVIYSNQEIVYYLANQDFIFYPNPTSTSKGFNVLRRDLEEATLVLYDVYGKKVKQFFLQDIVNSIPTSSLQRGLYFAAVIDKNGKRVTTQKIVVQ